MSDDGHEKTLEGPRKSCFMTWVSPEARALCARYDFADAGRAFIQFVLSTNLKWGRVMDFEKYGIYGFGAGPLTIYRFR